MEASFYSHTDLLGTLELNVIDKSMGVVGGLLKPTDKYKDLQHTFRNSNGVYTNELRDLRLSLQLKNDCFIFPTGGLSITDVLEFPNEIQVDALGVYGHIMDWFINGLENDFILEPWQPLDVNQKIYYEDELLKEIGKKKTSIINFLGLSNGHKLLEYEYCAYANSLMQDNVLYAVYKPRGKYQFAVVHLTFKKETKPEWPRTRFYKDFDEFRNNVMLEDRKDWES